MQAKKTGNRKKDVFVPILFLYFDKHLYKTLIYSVLLYNKITFTRFQYKIISKRFYVIFPIRREDRVFLKHSQNNQILNVS